MIAVINYLFLTMNKNHIITLFNQNVRNKDIKLLGFNKNHNGKIGYWLEEQMNIKHNSKNNPDINGYEMKKYSNRITLGDFSASEYIFSKNKNITKNDFIYYFGKPNPLKNNRYSWSGSCIPKYNIYNSYGQILRINDNNDILIEYSFSKDKRENKNNFPNFLKNDNITIALWNKNKLENNINNKFNIKGFFICKINNNKFNKILFGKPFDYNYFIENIKTNIIIFDSGMYIGNNRNYSIFKTINFDFWKKLIIEEY